MPRGRTMIGLALDSAGPGEGDGAGRRTMARVDVGGTSGRLAGLLDRQLRAARSERSEVRPFRPVVGRVDRPFMSPAGEDRCSLVAGARRLHLY